MQRQLHFFAKSVIATLLVWLTATTAWAAEGFVYSGFTATAGTGGNTGDEGYDKLVDGHYSYGASFTKWCTTEKGTPSGETGEYYWVDFHAANPIHINKYILTTGNDNETYHGRNPHSWIIKAKLNEDDAWTTIATVTNDGTLEDWNIFEFEYTLDVPGEYKYFRFMISEIVTYPGDDEYGNGANNSVMQLGELCFKGADPKNLNYSTISGLQSLYWYTGNTIDIDFTVKDYLDNTLNSTEHYNYALTLNGNPVTEVKEKGVYTLTATGKDNYTGSISTTFKVNNEIEIGTGTETKAGLPTSYSYFTLTQQIYTSAEIEKEGNISSISFYNEGKSQSRTMDVYLVNTTKSSFASDNDWINPSATDMVYSGEVTLLQDDWTTITFNTPFVYDNTYNLAVIIVDQTHQNGGYEVYGRVYAAPAQTIVRSHPQNISDIENMYHVFGRRENVKNQIRLEITPSDVTICPAPTGISISNIGLNAATVTWTDEGTKWNLQYKSNGDSEWTTVNDLTNKSYTFSNLSAATGYIVRVQTVGNNGNSHWTSTSFTTSASLPFTENFDNGTIPTGWYQYKGLLSDVLNGASLTPVYLVWNFGTSCDVFNRHTNLEITGENNRNWLVMPTMQIGDQTHLSFDMALTQNHTSNLPDPNGTDDKFVVLITTNNGDTWTILRQWDNAGSAYVYNDITNSAEGEQVIIDLKDYKGQNVAIAFYGESTVYNADNQLHIDNVMMVDQIIYPRPAYLTMSEIGVTSATLGWTEEGTATQWEICLNDDEDHTIIANSNPFTLTGLTAETTYFAKVRSIIDSNEKTAWSTAIKFTPTAKIAIGTGSNSSDNVPFNNYYNYTLTQQIYTSAELGSAGLIEYIDFWKDNNIYTQRDLNIYMVSTSKNAFNDEHDWIPVTDDDLVFSGAVTFADNDWTSIKLDYSFIYDGTQNVAIIIDDNTGGCSSYSDFLTYNISANQSLYYRADDYNPDPMNPNISGSFSSSKNYIRILKSPLGEYIRPTRLAVNEIGPNFAKMSWQENSIATEWVVAYKAEVDNTDFVEVSATSNPFTLSNLTPNTAYTVKVRPACDNNQLWSRTFKFTTLVSNPLPFDVTANNVTPASATISWKGFGDSYNVKYGTIFLNEGFESGTMPDGWSCEGSSTWEVGTGNSNNSSSSFSHGEGKTAYIQHTSSENQTYLVTPTMNLSGKEEAILSFCYINRRWGSDIDEFGIYYRVNNGSWTELWSTDEAHEDWTEQEITLTNLADNYEIGFKMTDNWGYGVGIDDIVIYTISETTINTTEQTITLTGLSGNTTYIYEVQSVKAGEENSDWTTLNHFTTSDDIVLADNADNSSIISLCDGVTVNATLADRTLVKDGNWNTLCLPFSLSEEQIAASSLAGATIKELNAANSHLTNGTLTLVFSTVNAITAGQPYIVKWETAGSNISDPVFTDVVINSAAPAEVVSTDNNVKFVGQYSPFTIDDSNKGEILFVGANNKISYSKSNRTLKSCRAHFLLPAATTARNINIDFGDGEVTEIKSVNATLSEGEDAVYNLQGQRVNAPKKGLFIQNGKKVVIK